MQLYGYRSSKSRRLNRICFCYDCLADEIKNKTCRARNRKRARRLGKQEIKDQYYEDK